MSAKDASPRALLRGTFQTLVERGVVPFEQDYRGTFVEFYDVIQQGHPDLCLYEQMAERYGHPILEMGCGNGRILIPLAERGYEVVGVDDSPDMLRAARARVERLSKTVARRVELKQMDMRRLKLSRQFALVLVAMDTFLCLARRRDRLATVRGARRHLREEGGLIIDISLSRPSQKARRPSVSVFRNPVGATRAVISITQEFPDKKAKGRILNFLNVWLWRERAPSVSISATREWCGNARELSAILREAGLRIAGRYSDYQGTPYKAGNTNLVVVAERP